MMIPPLAPVAALFSALPFAGYALAGIGLFIMALVVARAVFSR